MKVIICLDLPDIVVTMVGNHVAINPESGPVINLTREAAIELLEVLQALSDDGKLNENM